MNDGVRRKSSNTVALLLFTAAAGTLVLAVYMARGTGGKASVTMRTSSYSIVPAPFPAGSVAGRLVAGTNAAAAVARSRMVPLREECEPVFQLSPNGGLPNAVVTIEGITRGSAPRNPEPLLRVGRCGFDPPVYTGLAGATARVQASGEHRIQSFMGGVRVFDAAKEGAAVLTLVDAGRWTVRCASGHPGERAWIVAAEHPYLTVTDSRGRFDLGHVPVGTWTMRVWHPIAGELEHSVEVTPSETTRVEITLDSPS